MVSNIRRTGVGRRSFEKDVEAFRVASNTYGGGGVGTDHGSLTGLADDDHSQYAHLSQNESILGQWQYAPGSPQAPFTLSANAQGQKVVGLNADELDGAHWIAIDSDLIPLTNDAYDLGSSAKLWKKGYLSELEALLFVENSIHVEAGWFMIGYNQGTLQEEVDDTETDIDFGIDETGSNGLAVNDFILLRGYLQVEYMQITAQPGGAGTTIWTVVRDKDGTGANVWPQGAVFLVLGYDGDGRIELVAGQTDSPRISITEQGTTYSAQNERVRIGNMRGSFGAGANDYYGFGAGDYSGGNYLAYNETDGFILSAGNGAVRITSSGVEFQELEQATWYADGGWTTRIGFISSYYASTTDWFLNFTSDSGAVRVRLRSTAALGQYLHLRSPTILVNRGTTSAEFNINGGLYVGAAGIGLSTDNDIRAAGSVHVGTGLFVGSDTGTEFNNDIVVQGGVIVGSTGTDPPTGDLRCTGGLSVGSATVNMSAGQGYFSSKIFVNDTVNSKMTNGVTVKTTDTTETFSSKGDGVHAFTANTEADTHLTISPVSDSDGGAYVTGYGGSTLGLVLQGAAEVESSARSTTAPAMIRTNSWKWNGTTGTTNPSADVNIIAFRSGSNTRMILDANGNLHLDGTSNNGVWDEYDDIKLLTVARISLLSPEHALRKRFSDWVDYARPILEATNVVTVNDGQYGNDNDGSTFINVNNMLMLHSDAIRQVYSNLMKEITDLKKQILQLEARNENHN